MKLGVKILSFTIIFLFLASASVYAFGSSTSSNSQTNQNVTNSSNSSTIVINCDVQTTLRERVKCRLQNDISEGTIEESCNSLANADQTSCRKLYTDSSVCYQRTGQAKVLCFREKAGIAQSLGISNSLAKRKYAVLLLYELQERVEARYKAGTLTADEASQLINKIVETKKIILENKSKAEIRTKMLELKTEWRQTIQ